MLKFTLTAFLACCLNFQATSQTAFSWLDGNRVDTILAASTYTALQFDQVNSSNDTLILGIKTLVNSIPSTWDGMVCVFGKCLGSIPPVGDSAVMDPIYDSINGFVKLTVNPFSGQEIATLKIFVYDMANSSDGDTATWHINQQTSGLIETIMGHVILFP